MKELLQEYKGRRKFEIEVHPAQSEGYMVSILEDGRICQRVGPFPSKADAVKAMDDIKADWREKPGLEGFSIGRDGKKHDSEFFGDLD